MRLVDIPHTTSTVAPPPSASATLRSFVVRSKSVNSVRDSSSTINCILADRGERLELENLLVMLLRRMIGCIERTDTAALRDLIRADGMLAIVEVPQLTDY
ncbi:unnamed protein product [Schistocephalus solidus]|uniref:Uncharacterized protein n=1 Tax=Schistocephalus solidus TaxID=70667 RepID=A0A3P7DNQ8_SCHSO|nr:unnamed protein product [Schistocephalus solidus]